MDDDGTALVADFGRSKLVEHRGFTTATIAGSTRQMAPELLPHDKDEYEDAPHLTKEADVYGFSMVALEVSDLLCPIHILWDPLREVTNYMLLCHRVYLLTAHLY